LADVRHGRFVGRSAERELFRSALLTPTPPFAVLYVSGPGGVGKSALVREYARIAAECVRPVVFLDARNVDPSQAGLLSALNQTIGETAADSDPARSWPPGAVLIIDTYEAFAPLDGWLRETFLPQLPDATLIVLAGRTPPATGWRTDLDWASLTHPIALRNLRVDESRTYLTIRGIPQEQHETALAFSHGHPLALALVADALVRGDPLSSFNPREEPDVVRTLLERIVEDAPTVLHRRALEVCVLAWATTEALLADVLDLADAGELFAWLHGLSFIESGAYGLFPHDLAREALDSDLRWRNPDGLHRLSRRISAALYAKLQQTGRGAQQRIWFDLLHLHRHDPFYQAYFDWDALGSAFAEPATPAEHAVILDLVRRHQGAAAAGIARYWLARQPDAFLVYRDLTGDVFGFMAQLALHTATPRDQDADPAVAAALRFMARRGPPRSGEEAVHLRFWMDREHYQSASSAVNLTAINSSIFWTTHPNLAWNFIAVSDPEYFTPHFSSIHIWREPGADFEVDGRRYAIFAHDWRVEPIESWLAVKAEPTSPHAEAPPLQPVASSSQRLVLSEEEFAAAVRQALRDYTRPQALAANPLLRSRLTAETAGRSPAGSTLQTRIREAAEQLRSNPRDEKLYRAIHRTYLEPAATQELAAERLGLPFSTYRRHLTTGIARITASLWQRELHESAP
jgi:hypothetical protein